MMRAATSVVNCNIVPVAWDDYKGGIRGKNT